MTIRIPTLDQIIGALGFTALVLVLTVIIIGCLVVLAFGAWVLWLIATGAA